MAHKRVFLIKEIIMGLGLLRKLYPTAQPVGHFGDKVSKKERRKLHADIQGHHLVTVEPPKKHRLFCTFSRGFKTKVRHVKLTVGLEKPNRQKRDLNRNYRIDAFYSRSPSSELVKKFGVPVFGS